MQGDITAVYNNVGTKLVSYVYDAWGNTTTSYHNGGNSSYAKYNPFTYRGYYYDFDLGLYRTNTRYYDARVGRWINVDGMISGVSGSVNGFNLYVYCFNNPIAYTDSTGNWPDWKKVEKYCYDILDAYISSLEITVGFGIGFGVNVLDTFTADLSRDNYVGFDDGETVTGNIIASEISLLDVEGLSIGDTYNLLVEKGGKRVTNSGSIYDSPFEMVNYPDVTHGNLITFFPVSISESGEVILGVSGSAHFIFGGSFSVAINLSEFKERLKAI